MTKLRSLLLLLPFFMALAGVLGMSLLATRAAAAHPGPSTTRVSVASDGTQGSDESFTPAIGAHGRYVAFDSMASNLVGGDTNGSPDVFVHDRQAGTTTRVSVASDGTQGNGVSFTGYSSVIGAHGRYVAFVSLASNLVAGDTNGIEDVFVHDRKTGTTTRVSVASDGSQGNNMSRGPAISGDGRSVTFESLASNLVAGDTNSLWDVFARDRETGTITKVSVASDGTHGNGVSRNPSISAAGRYAVFESLASNLVAGETNGTWDVFFHDRKTGITTRVSVASDGTQGNGVSEFPSVGANGDLVAFRSSSSNLVTGDTNSTGDVFVHDEDD
ncbi:MAG: hypothetical protein HY685_05090 [Chloroflexi bacterium]|nr:hypothetical protein [Chloroflexota bacterium]